MSSWKDYKVSWVEDRPDGGMWHNGPNNGWVTVTHVPTMQSVTVYGRRQHKCRELATAALDLIVSESCFECCRFPERMTAEHHPQHEEERQWDT